MRQLSGVALVLGPVVWFAGLLVRHLAARDVDLGELPFAAPEQLTAYAQNPALTTAGYALFALGSLLMLPAVIAFARTVAAKSPWPAALGGTLFAAGLFARWYFSGIDLMAFELVDTLGLQQATDFVMKSYVDLSYGLWRIPVSASAGSILGAVLLAIGAYRARAMGLIRCALLLAYGWVFMGVLKETTLLTVLTGGLSACLVFIPFGVAELRKRVE